MTPINENVEDIDFSQFYEYCGEYVPTDEEIEMNLTQLIKKENNIKEDDPF